MLQKIVAWLNAARPRTLPLSVSGVIVGTALANLYEKNNLLIFIFALFTTISFQVTSNFANDYGDGVKGTDNSDRIGPKRALQSGSLTRQELKGGIIISVLISLVLISTLLYTAFGLENMGYIVVFGILGLVSIWAAIKYTVGSSAYGYKGLGDVFVFLFFGLTGVLGSMFLYTKFLTWMAWLPAITIGLLSVGVLNLNNLRDCESDKKAHKNTMVVKMGFQNGKRYHFMLLVFGFLSMFTFVLMNAGKWYQWFVLLAFIPVAIHMRTVYRTEEPILLDPELKKLALSTFLLSLIFYGTFY